MKRFLSIISFLLAFAQFSWATHNRAGEITVEQVSGLTYKVTITTYTRDSSPADRPELEIFWGDGTSDTIPRVNGNGNGVIVGSDIKKNVYTGLHTFPGPSTYTIYFEDPNRNAGVQNIPNSVNVPFYVWTEVTINPFLGSNSSPVLLNPPIDDACVNELYVHNPGAYDSDGDSISYELTVCLGANGDPINGYFIPPNVSVNAITGDFIWNTPTQLGEYNFAMKIKEWRNGVHIGTIIRDMQITVVNCNNDPPEIETIDEVCVEAGDTLQFGVDATDPQLNDIITLTATGGPFIDAENPALFSQVSGTSPISSNFFWHTACSDVQLQPHTISFRAADNGQPVNLVDYHTVFITVVAPAPENPQADPVGNSIQLSWDQSICSEAIGYKIYRRNGFYGFDPDTCETGVPAYTGYTQIASVEGLTNINFTDDNNGAGLTHGVDYCYMIVACFPDGAESYASEEVCASLVKDVPVITNVTITNTDVSNGSDTVVWSKPTELDTVQIPGPYEYRLYRSDDFAGGNFTLINTISGNTISEMDTVFEDTGINTEGSPYSYKIELFNNTPGDTFTVGSTQASSVFLSIAETDNRLILSWEEEVPWTNHEYVIYKQNQSLGFDSIGSTTTTTFIDSGLVNGTEYCYKVKSLGSYSAPGFAEPIINFSQIECGTPLDTVPPCEPQLQVEPECDNFRNILHWINPTANCANDAIEYRIYYTPVLNGEMEVIATITNLADTVFYHDNLESIAGCYAITSVDSFQNESPVPPIICVDNCPTYELPNSFSPGEDGVNDTFHPFPYQYVESVDMKIFNRWGNLVFETTDPDIGWDGTNKDTGRDCSEGVYYYICVVNEIRLEGIQQRTLTGFVHLFRDGN